MDKCYINGVGCVSGQETLNKDFLNSSIDYSHVSEIDAIKPEYKEFIPPAMIRRMSSGVKNSIVASTVAMQEASAKELDAIIVGTGMGCIQDSEVFLGKLLAYNEEYLTPTPFIQSTHNTVAGQIALGLKSKVYNFTYVHAGNSFQSALLDGMMLVSEEKQNRVLVGGVDELGKRSISLYRLVGIYKNEEETNHHILHSTTEGSIPGEVASFFVLGNEKTENTYTEIADVVLQNELDVENLPNFINQFLAKNNLSFSEIDTLLLGKSGDAKYDYYYDNVLEYFPTSTVLYFKHLFGETHTISGVALWIAAHLLKTQTIPASLYDSNSTTPNKTGKNVLIYNHFRGENHSLILLKNV